MFILHFILILLYIKGHKTSLLSRFRNQNTYSTINDIELMPGDYDDEFMKLFKHSATKPEYWSEKTQRKKIPYSKQIQRLQYRPTISGSKVTVTDRGFTAYFNIKESEDLDNLNETRNNNVYIKPTQIELSNFSYLFTKNIEKTREENNWSKFTTQIMFPTTMLLYTDIEVYRPTQSSTLESNIVSKIEKNSPKTWKSYFPTIPYKKYSSANMNLFTFSSTNKSAFLYFTTIKTEANEYETFTQNNKVLKNARIKNNKLLFSNSDKQAIADYKKISHDSHVPQKILKVIKTINKFDKGKPNFKFILLDAGLKTTPTATAASTITTDTTFILSTGTPKPLGKKCYTCGLNETQLGSTHCHKVFDSGVRSMKWKPFKTTCSGHTFIGGCFRRFLDIGKEYNERGCRHFPPLTGKTFASNRFVKLEYVLKEIRDGCISSPYASLTPFSRSISLYVRYTVCVCSKKYCNKSTLTTRKKTYLYLLPILSKVLLLYFV